LNVYTIVTKFKQVTQSTVSSEQNAILLQHKKMVLLAGRLINEIQVGRNCSVETCNAFFALPARGLHIAYRDESKQYSYNLKNSEIAQC
jgi:hypothetical protein